MLVGEGSPKSVKPRTFLVLVKLFVLLVALAIGGIVSEALLTLKVGHLFFLVILMIKNPNVRNLQNNTKY